jgi:hypothetical protein
MTFGRKVVLTIVAVLIIGTVGPYLLVSTGGHSHGVHAVSP